MAETDGVDVMTFHQFEVLAHQLFRNVVSGQRIVLVDIDSLQFDRLSVDEQHYVVLAVCGLLVDFLDFNPAETYVVGDDFGCLSVFFHRHKEPVQVGMFRSPCLYLFQVGSKLYRCLGSIARKTYLLFFLCHGGSLGIEQFVAYAKVGRVRMVVLQFHLQAEDTVTVSIVEGRGDAEVLHRSLGLRVDKDIALNAAHAPEVLTFQV